MNRRTLLKAIAATPLALASPPVQAAVAAKPEWLDWEARTSSCHFMHVLVEPHEVAMRPVRAEMRELAKGIGIPIEQLPAISLLQDFTLVGEKFRAALQRVKNPDYSRDIMVIPVDNNEFDGNGWMERTERGAWLVRGAEVSTRDAYDWPKENDGFHPTVLASALLWWALDQRRTELAERMGTCPALDRIRRLCIQVPV